MTAARFWTLTGGGLSLRGRSAWTRGGAEGGDPHFSDVVLLVHFDGADGATTATDETGRHTLTFNGTSQIDTARSVFGGASLFLPARDDSVSIPHSSDFIFDGDFTIEFRVFDTTPLDAETFVISKYNTTGNNRSWEFMYTSTGLVRFRMSTDGTGSGAGFTAIESAAGAFVGDAQRAVCLERSGSTVRIYIDGVMVAKGTRAGALFNNSTIPLRIGIRDGAAITGLSGWIDELRITKGTARYADDAGYTVATEAFPNG